MTDWLQPLNKLTLQKAFRSKAPQVTLKTSNGSQVFNCEYYTDKTADVGHTRKVLVKPAQPVPEGCNEFVPMGRFDIKDCLHSEWLTGQEVTPPKTPLISVS